MKINFNPTNPKAYLIANYFFVSLALWNNQTHGVYKLRAIIQVQSFIKCLSFRQVSFVQGYRLCIEKPCTWIILSNIYNIYIILCKRAWMQCWCHRTQSFPDEKSLIFTQSFLWWYYKLPDIKGQNNFLYWANTNFAICILSNQCINVTILYSYEVPVFTNKWIAF